MLRLIPRQVKLPAGVRFAQGTGTKVKKLEDMLAKSNRIPGTKGYKPTRVSNPTNAAALSASDAPPKQYKFNDITARDPEDQHHILHFEKSWHKRRRTDQRYKDAELGFVQKKPDFVRQSMIIRKKLTPEVLEEYLDFDLSNEIVYGTRSVLSALKTRVVRKVFLGGRGSSTAREVLDYCIKYDIPIVEATEVSELIKAYDLQKGVTNVAIAEVVPRDVVPEVSSLPYDIATRSYSFGLSTSEQTTRGSKPYPVGVYLDRVTDTYNIGAIIRTCYYLGADFVIVGGTHRLKITENILRSSAGAADFMRMGHVTNTTRFLFRLPPAWQLIATVVPKEDRLRRQTASSAVLLDGLPAISAEHPTILLIGAEDKGLRPQVARLAQHRCSIMPVAKVDSLVDSLNVSIATALMVERLCSNINIKSAS